MHNMVFIVMEAVNPTKGWVFNYFFLDAFKTQDEALQYCSELNSDNTIYMHSYSTFKQGHLNRGERGFKPHFLIIYKNLGE